MKINRASVLGNGRNNKPAARNGLKRNTVGRPKSGVVPLDAEGTILRGALHLFAELGFNAVSTKEIAAAAGLNTALIYYYFGSKEELFRRCVVLAATEAAALFAQTPDQSAPAEAQVLAWLASHQTGFRTIQRLLRIALSYSASVVKEPEADAAMQAYHDAARDSLNDALRRGIADRTFTGLDVEQTVTFVTRFLDGVYVRAILVPDYQPFDDIAQLRGFVESRLQAAGLREPSRVRT